MTVSLVNKQYNLVLLEAQLILINIFDSKQMKPKRGYYDIFLKTCAKYPSKIAVRHYDNDIYKLYTYSELYGVCEYITQNLQQLKCNKGVIGLVSERNIIIPCMIAAAHKCCTSFMFVDPNQDIEYVAKELEFTIVITIKSIPDNNPILFGKKPDKTVSVFHLTLYFYNCDFPTEVINKHAHQHSFIAMTSGSTGEPKHIQVPIHCIQPNIDDLTKIFSITSNDVIYFSTPLTFDPSMVEILLACMNGASLLIAPERTDTLFPVNRQNSVTFWQTTPSKFLQFSNCDIKNKILCANSTLKILALGGEPMHSINRLKELKSCANKTRIFALYGVTEMSCWACVTEVDLNTLDKDREIPLGNCLSETEVVIDKMKENKNMGKIILISKTRQCILLNKHKGNNEENCLKFVDTGDIGEVRNGTIYYRGRRDDTIKRFGHKVNLQSIEATIMQCPRVKTCACVWLLKPMLLIVYFSSETINSQELSDFLKCKLDDKHWPDRIIRVDNLPINKHGKISKQDLCKMYERTTGIPQTIDALKVRFLKELKVVTNKYFTYDQIKNKNFFSIGGTSFLAISMCNNLSLTFPPFGKLILPYLLSQKNTINEIMNIAQKEILGNDNTVKLSVKRSKTNSLSKVDSKVYNQDTPPSKKPNMDSRTSMIEFLTMWMYDTGKCVDASPVLFQSGFNLYVTVGSHSGKIIVVDARSGESQGVVDLKSRIEASVLCLTDIQTPCGVVGSYNGTVVCFSLETVEEIWRINIGSMVKSQAAYCNGQLYVASYDGNVRCINLSTGAVMETICVCDQGISADLVLAKNEYVLLGSLSGVCANIHVHTNIVMWRCSVGSPVFANPVVYDEDKFVVFAEVNGEIHCRTVEKGIKIWKFQGVKGNIFSSLYIKKIDKIKWQIVFGCHDKHVYSLYIKNFHPSLHWKTEVTSPVYSTPCSLGDKGILAFTTDGNLCVVNADNGLIEAMHQFPNETFSSPVVYGDYIFIGCRNDCLYSVKYVVNC